MKKPFKNIDSKLWTALTSSPYYAINYEELLGTSPQKIREAELQLSLAEKKIDIPEQLHLEDLQIPSAESGRSIRLRIYRPKSKKKCAVLLYFHGGAFIYGTVEQYDALFFRLALDVELTIVSVDYRLAPEHPFPAALHDGYDTLLWLHRNADQIGGNPQDIYIGGSSAGATIAASITHLARDRGQVNIKHQYLLYPPMSNQLQTLSMDELSHAPMQTKRAAEWMWKHYLNVAISTSKRYAVPLEEENFHDLPSTTLIVCELDPLKDEAKAYAKKLKNAAIEVHLIEIEAAIHAFDFFECPLSERFYNLQVQLIQSFLKPVK